MLKGAATLIRLPKLAATLEEIRPGAEVHIPFEHPDYIDHACIDLIPKWEELTSNFHRRRTGLRKDDVRVSI